MAITNYAELQTAIANYTHRSDIAGVAPDFIRLAEARFNRTLRTLDMERRSNTTLTSEYLSFPVDYLELRNIQVGSGSSAEFLTYCTPQQIDEFAIKQGGGTCYYTIIGQEFQFAPAPTVSNPLTIEIAYWQRIPILGSTVGASTVTTNWLLTKNPDAYLYGSLLQSEAYGYKDARLPLWKMAYDEAINEINLLDERGRWGGGSLQMRRLA